MLEGINVIGFQASQEGVVELKAKEAATQNELPESFKAATSEEVNRAVGLATKAAQTFAKTSPESRAQFLEAIAEEIENLGDLLIERASSETGLPVARLEGERVRTCTQLRLFSNVVQEGSWVGATIDCADINRAPIPKPDVRKMLVGIGPVLVFTASNFPLAFSTAGGDTASALAAGCPVIVKAHEAHLGTNELVSKAIKKAAERTGMPEGVFSSLNGEGFKTGEQLIQHPDIKAIAFTGSYNGGMAIYQMAQKREEPIPVFAEMGSINPVVLCPQMIKEKGEEVAKTYAGSITLGAGQFCTNPGLLIGLRSPETDHFKQQLTKELNEVPKAIMLTDGISKNFSRNIRLVLSQQGVLCPTIGSATLAVTTAKNFTANPALHHEVFGPFSLLVECENEDELLVVIESLQGQLTGTIMAHENDTSLAKEVAGALQEKVGRIIWNGAPTGVEVGHAMHHGGPFPAATDSRFTSVGVSAIDRFARPVCYQNFPQELLPDALKDDNTLNILRKVDGKWTR